LGFALADRTASAVIFHERRCSPPPSGVEDVGEPPAASRSAGLPAVGALTTHAAAASELDLSGPLIFASAQASRASRV
jgi:hypothetical protein